MAIDDNGPAPTADGVNSHLVEYGQVIHAADPTKPIYNPGETVVAHAERFGGAGIPVHLPNKMVVGTLEQHATGVGLTTLDMAKVTPEMTGKVTARDDAAWRQLAAQMSSDSSATQVASAAAPSPGVDVMPRLQPNGVAPYVDQGGVPGPPVQFVQLADGRLVPVSPTSFATPFVMPATAAPPAAALAPPAGDYGAIDLPYLAQGEARPPRETVIFFWPHAQQQTRFHHACLSPSGRVITLVYDHRYDGDRIAPTETDRPIRVKIPSLQFDGFVEIYSDFHLTLGCMDLLNLVVARSENSEES